MAESGWTARAVASRRRRAGGGRRAAPLGATGLPASWRGGPAGPCAWSVRAARLRAAPQRHTAGQEIQATAPVW